MHKFEMYDKFPSPDVSIPHLIKTKLSVHDKVQNAGALHAECEQDLPAMLYELLHHWKYGECPSESPMGVSQMQCLRGEVLHTWSMMKAPLRKMPTWQKMHALRSTMVPCSSSSRSQSCAKEADR